MADRTFSGVFSILQMPFNEAGQIILEICGQKSNTPSAVAFTVWASLSDPKLTNSTIMNAKC